jgi:hypothetical protein
MVAVGARLEVISSRLLEHAPRPAKYRERQP